MDLYRGVSPFCSGPLRMLLVVDIGVRNQLDIDLYRGRRIAPLFQPLQGFPSRDCLCFLRDCFPWKRILHAQRSPRPLLCNLCSPMGSWAFLYLGGTCSRLRRIGRKIWDWRFEFYWCTGLWHVGGGFHPSGLLWPPGCNKVSTVIEGEILVFPEEVLLDMDIGGMWGRHFWQ